MATSSKRDILYVDDEPENIVVFEAALEDEFNIWTASSGAEALKLLERVPAPVVVTDQRMPEMSGTQLFEILRATHPHIKRIILTGYSEPEAMADAINKGEVFYFLKKPWDHGSLVSVLIRAIEAHDLALANSTLMNRLVEADRCAILGRSAARVAHEMGNQLSMLPLLELIEQEYGNDGNLQQMAQFTRDTYERLVDLINEVKSFVRFEAVSLATRPFSLVALLHELLDFLRYDPLLGTAPVVFKFDQDAVVDCNKVKLQQVLVNLIKNAFHAIQATAGGQIRLHLSVIEGQAEIRVGDNGCGISAEHLQHIWEPFFTTKGDHGTGLGLDIAREIIHAHHGKIDCQSTLGKGTEFILRLPVSRGKTSGALA